MGRDPTRTCKNPLGVGGVALHEWVFGTKTFQALFGKDGGSTGIDDDFAARDSKPRSVDLGRNMFGPVRGPWPDDAWKGWWGSNPPYHTPVFVLTHHDRAPIEMEGGTTFYFVTDGIASALRQATDAAKGKMFASEAGSPSSRVSCRGTCRRNSPGDCSGPSGGRRTPPP